MSITLECPLCAAVVADGVDELGPGRCPACRARFEGDYRLHFHLAPPLLAKRDPVSGQPLGSMGEPYNYVFAGKLIRFCCAGCIPAFDANPSAVAAKVYGAASGSGE